MPSQSSISNGGDRITAIVPVFNRFEYLADCLHSIFSQTRAPDEVLVIDDCSTESITDYLAGTDYRNCVTVVRTDRNRGPAGGRNFGWRRATGNLIAFIDSDDLWEPYKTEVQLGWLRQNGDVAGVYGGLTAFYPDGTSHPWATDRPPQVTVANALADCNICVQTLLIRRQVLESIGGFDETFGILDDQDVAVRLAQQGHRIDFISDPPMGRLRRNSQNQSGNARLYFQEDLIINKRYGKLLNQVYGPGSRRVHLARAVRRFGNSVNHMGVPSRIMARALEWSAPRSRMPRHGNPNL